jgi:hypothetical protein
MVHDGARAAGKSSRKPMPGGYDFDDRTAFHRALALGFNGAR